MLDNYILIESLKGSDVLVLQNVIMCFYYWSKEVM